MELTSVCRPAVRCWLRLPSTAHVVDVWDTRPRGGELVSSVCVVRDICTFVDHSRYVTHVVFLGTNPVVWWSGLSDFHIPMPFDVRVKVSLVALVISSDSITCDYRIAVHIHIYKLFRKTEKILLLLLLRTFQIGAPKLLTFGCFENRTTKIYVRMTVVRIDTAVMSI